MVDKPGRRKKQKFPWAKAAIAAVVAALVLAGGWVGYWNYIYQAPPVYAQIGTSQGYIYVELYPSCAPQTVANFVNLTNSGFYNDLVWHRIAPGFVIQTGDPNTRGGAGNRSTWGAGQSSKQIPLEWCGKLHNYAGYLGMASTSAKGPSTSQFYINLANSSYTSLDGSYTVFGKVISGMNVVCALANNRTNPVYTSTKVSPSYLYDQPIYPAKSMMNNVTIISASAAPAPEPIKAC